MSDAHSSRRLGKDDVYIVTTLDGSATLFSRAYQSTYHSITGAVSESRHVFVQNGLYLLRHLPLVSILEMGFGTGLNAFLAYLFGHKNHLTVNYTGIEAFPIETKLALQLEYPGYLVADQLSDIYLRMHQEERFTAGNFNFQKFLQLESVDANQKFDCIFFDAFSPAVHGELWEQNIFNQISEMTSTGGLLVTYCAQGEVRRKMERAGYEVNRIPGAPGKRQMIQAFKR